MKNPKFNPNEWVVFKMDNGGAFGKITGGNYTENEEWMYHVKNAQVPEKIITVAEVDITAKSDGASWVSVQ